MEQLISCPECGHQFQPTDVIRNALEAEVRATLEAEFRAKARDSSVREADLVRREREIEERDRQSAIEVQRTLTEETRRIREEVEREARERFGNETRQVKEEMEREVGAAREKVAAAVLKETDLLRRQREVEDREREVALQLEIRLREEIERIQREADQRLQHATEALQSAKDRELADANEKLIAASAREAEFARRERELDEVARTADLTLERRVEQELERIREQADQHAREHFQREANLEISAKQREFDAFREQDTRAAALRAEELAEARRKLGEAASKEADILRRERELDSQRVEAELEVERKLSAEVARARETAENAAEERHRVAAEGVAQRQRLREEELLVNNGAMQRTIEDLQRKLQQGSQQLQGEAQEASLKQLLVRSFPRDGIHDVTTGTQGADLTQLVRDEFGSECGVVLWESKRTKAWSDDWLPKLRDDQRENGAHCAVLVTQAMPPGLSHFGQQDGIWICGWSHAVALAAVLRAGMIDVATARKAIQGQSEKVQLIYHYLTSHQFKQRVEGVVEALAEMQDDLATERRAITAIWRKRERQLERAHNNVAGIYGDLRGISGSQIASIPELELPEGDLVGMLESGDPEGFEPPASVVRGSLPDGALVELLFDLVPHDGASIGNKSLTTRFVDEAMIRLSRRVSADDYAQCKEVLVSQRRIRRGVGRGGSVKRISKE